MRQLFALGKTRAEVRDLLQYDNMGAIYNVWKKWATGVSYGRRPRTTTDPKAEWVTYGIEIEGYGPGRRAVAEELGRCGLVAEVDGEDNRQHSYNHTNDRHDIWHVKTDSSIDGAGAFELVSPILKKAEGFYKLEKALWALDGVNARVNNSTGLHVHLGVGDMDFEQQRNVYINYCRAQQVISSFMPESRRSAGYAMPMADWMTTLAERAEDIEELCRVNTARYSALNTNSYSLHKTFEFRQHQGTTNYVKIRAWVEFLQRMVAWSKENRLERNATSLDELAWLTPELKDYYAYRTAHNA